MKKRVVLCMGQYCNRGGQAEPFYSLLERLLGERGPAWMAKGPVRWEIAACLSMCGGGPNLIVYPDETVYNHLDLATLEQVIRALLEEAAREGDPRP